VAFPTATDINDSEEIRISTSDATSHPISCCGGLTGLLAHSQAIESIVDETVALEWLRSNKKQVRNHVFEYENA
jgi:hypothetical protein